MAGVCREISPKLEACGGSIMGRRSCVTAHTIGHRGKDPVKISSVIGRSFLPGKVLSVQLAPCSPEYTVNQLPVCKSGSMSTHKYSAFRPSPPPSLPFIHHRTRQDLYHCRSTNKLIDTVIPFNETSLRTSSLANSVVIISDSKSFTTNPAYELLPLPTPYPPLPATRFRAPPPLIPPPNPLSSPTTSSSTSALSLRPWLSTPR